MPISTNRPAEGQQLDPGAHGRAGQGVEHDVDAIAVGVMPDLLGELDAARVVDMLNAHVAQQLSALRAAGRGEDLGPRGPGDRDRRLSHPAGRGVNQHLVLGLDAGQFVQAVPGGGVRGGDRGGLGVGQARRHRRGQAGIAGDKRAPTSVGCHAAHAVPDPVVGDAGPDRGHHAGEIGAELRQRSVEGGVSAERDQHVGEVDAGRADGDLDLSGSRRHPVDRGEFHRLQVAGRADLQAHTVVPVVHDRGFPLVGAQRSRAQPGGVPLVVAPRGLVLVGSGQQLACQLLGIGALVDVDLRGAQVRVLGADHPQQATRPGLLEVDGVVCEHRLRVPGHQVQARRLAGDSGQLAGDAHQTLDVVAAGVHRMHRRTLGVSTTTPVNPAGLGSIGML